MTRGGASLIACTIDGNHRLNTGMGRLVRRALRGTSLYRAYRWLTTSVVTVDQFISAHSQLVLARA